MASLPWLWVIEALADLKAADTSVLREVISRVPGFATEAPESLRERVALRYLEEQCSSSGDVPSASGDGSGIDVACSSEEILCRKVAAQVNRERDISELSSHVLRQFILQKKAVLPKSSLDLLKESIQEGRSWKESSGLFTLNAVDVVQCNNGDDHKHVDTCKLRNSNSQSHSGSQGPMTLDVDHGSVDVQEEPFGSEKHLSQENVSDVNMGNKVCGNIVSTGASDAQLLEKCSTHQLSENIDCNGGESAKQVDALALGNSSVSLRDPSASRQDLPEWNDSVCEKKNSAQQMRQSSPPLLPCREKTSLQHRPLNEIVNIVAQSNCKNDNFDGEPSIVPETQSEGGVSDDTPFNFDSNDDIFTSEKDRLLASQIHANPDSTLGEWSEQGLCIKCDKGGQLLSCSARGCLIAVHESCFSPSNNFKGAGLFYCPFCSYKRASIAYCNARKNVFRARKALSVFIGRDLAQGRRKKLPPASTFGRTSRAGVDENTDHVNSFHSEEYQRQKLDDNPVKSKEHDHGIRDANVCYDDNLSSKYSAPPQSDRRYGVSHYEAELTHCEMVSGLQNITDMQSLSNVSKTMDTGKLPCGEKVTPPINQKADASLINRQCEEGNGSEFNGLAEHQHIGQPDATTENGNLHHEATDTCQNRYNDASRAEQKDGLNSVNEHAHVEKLKNEEQLRAAPSPDTWRGTSTSSPSKRHGKRRCGVTIGKRRHTQAAVENTNREKYTSGISNKHVFLESQRVTTSPDNGDDLKSLNTQLSERHAKRRRHDAAMHRINDPPETFGKQQREKSSPGRSSKRIAQPKRCYNQWTILGRRQKLFWTPEEEEILKEAVQRFGDRDGIFPWTRILEFGRHVFHRSRQPGDLKDKWRNIRKNEVKQEM